MDQELNLQLYHYLLLTRRSEEAIIKYYDQDDMKTPMHMSMGQEAIPAGICHALKPNGRVFCSYRSHAAFLCQTENVETFFAELYGKISSPVQGVAGSMHLSSPEEGHICSSAVVGSVLPVAIGYAFSAKQRKTGEIPCVFFGDGAVDEGVFWESVNVACLMELPVMFVCEDNNMAVHTARHKRSGYDSLGDIVRQFRCNFFETNSTDVEVVYNLAVEAREKIVNEGKPSFMLARCYRYLEHVGVNPDFDAGYRPEAEFEEWKSRDPLLVQRAKLIAGGIPEARLAEIEQEVDKRIENSVKAAQAADLPDATRLYQHVFYEKD